MPVKQETSSEYFKSLKSITYVLLFSLLMMSIFSLILTLKEELEIVNLDNKDIISVFIIGGIIIFIWSTKKKYPKSLQRISVIKNLEIKMFKFRYNLIIYFAKMVLASFIALIGLYYLNENSFFIIPFLSLLAILTYYPTQGSVIKSLGLNDEEAKKVKDPDAIVCEIAAH